MLLLTVAGRRSGLPRSTCVRFLAHDGGWVVWGTASGSARDPDWFENLRRAGRATIQMGAATRDVAARELVGRERDVVWQDVVLAQVPRVERYARRAGRTIPVAKLDPL